MVSSSLFTIFQVEGSHILWDPPKVTVPVAARKIWAENCLMLIDAPEARLAALSEYAWAASKSAIPVHLIVLVIGKFSRPTRANKQSSRCLD